MPRLQGSLIKKALNDACVSHPSGPSARLQNIQTQLKPPNQTEGSIASVAAAGYALHETITERIIRDGETMEPASDIRFNHDDKAGRSLI
jgi:hypothetical protein